MKRPEQRREVSPYHSAVSYATRWVRAGIAIAIMSVLGWLGACSDSPTDPCSDCQPAGPLVVSDPVSARSPASAAGAASTLTSSAGDEVAYVSLAPGTVPTGRTATIRRVGGGGSIITAMFDGGFDPVPVGAEAGDSIEIVVTDATGGPLFQARVAVAAARPPVVVRTDPPRRKTDVPLNSAIVVVFSEPVDASTLTSGSLHLRQGVTSVPGRLEFRDAEHLRAAFVPDASLAAGTDYQLVVTQGIRDLDGEPLEAPVTVEFTTESGPAPVASVTVDPSALTLTPGATLPLMATVYDSAGNPLTGRAITWSSADTTVATVSAAAVVTGVSLGTTTVTATVEGKSATSTINVERLVFSFVSAGLEFSCGITTGGAAYCWGENFAGRLGIGSTTSDTLTSPMAVVGGLTFATLSAGWQHVCGLTTDGAAYCWGDGYAGLGHAPTDLCQYFTGVETILKPCSPQPGAVEGGLRFVAITAGVYHTCGLTSGGAAYCWGNNWFGELGNGEKGEIVNGEVRQNYSVTPVAVSGGLTFRSLSAGGWYGGVTCGVTTDGIAYCWGLGNRATLGHEATDVCQDGDGVQVWVVSCSTRPVAVDGGLTFSVVDADQDLACGLTSGGAAYCWGMYPEGPGSTQPVQVSGGLTFVALSVGYQRNACGVTSDGAAYCWGQVPTAVGSGFVQTEYTSLPRAVPGGLTFATVTVGGDQHNCGVTPGGTAYCWGTNGKGALGDGSTLSSLAPVKVAGQP